MTIEVEEKEVPIEVLALSDRIKKILEPTFVYYDRVAEVVALGLATKSNVWLHGDGGYGKSHMLETIVTGLELMPETYVQAFGQGMTPEKLVGNLDLRTLNDEGLFRFNIHESFLVKRFAIFEEMPDAAVPVLFMLKDTLERKLFRDGVQQVPMKTQTIFVCSNRSPATVAEYGVDAAALVQRWALEELVRWPVHNDQAYITLLKKQGPKIPGPDLGTALEPLAKLLAEASARGEPIPPRVALAAVRTIKGYAEICGSKVIGREAFAALKYVRGLQALGSNIDKEVQDALTRTEAEKVFITTTSDFGKLVADAEKATTPIQCLQAIKKLRAFANDRLNALKVTDNLVEHKAKLVLQATQLLNTLAKKAEDATNI
jgi:MoxR-like ATPase